MSLNELALALGCDRQWQAAGGGCPAREKGARLEMAPEQQTTQNAAQSVRILFSGFLEGRFFLWSMEACRIPVAWTVADG